MLSTADKSNAAGPVPHPGISFSDRLEHDLGQSLYDAAEPGKPMALVLVCLNSFTLFSRLYGSEAAARVLDRLQEMLRRLGPKSMGRARLLALEADDPGSMVMMLQDGPELLTHLMERSLVLRAALRQHLNKEMIQITGQSLALSIGFARVEPAPPQRLPELVYRALRDARQVAEGSLDVKSMNLLEEFRRLVEQPLLHSVYEPIVDLQSGQVKGWEALARGPKDDYFHSPEVMFDFADEVGALFHLEKACLGQAIRGVGAMEPNQKLFLNINPETLADPKFRDGETLRLLADYGLTPQDVVFEITERHSISDFSQFHRTMQHYRAQGFSLAIDDMGTGYSGLMRIAFLRPEFLKVDMSLIRGIDSNPMQRALVETLVTFAEKVGGTLIAEGIETATEFSSLRGMGVRYGQGYYLARPARAKPSPKISRVNFRTGQGEAALQYNQCSLPVRNLVEQAPQVGPQATVREVKEILDKAPISGCLVVDDGRPLGLVMSHNLDRILGTPFGSSLYYDRDVSLVMDAQALMVESSTPVQQVAEKAMAREKLKLYDHIVVTAQGRALGVVSVQRMLDALAKVQVEMAKGVNPLTGLPGGVVLEQEIEQRSASEEQASIIYVDLDHFKAYNDTYGFEAGDRMIRMLADVLQWAVRRHGNPADLVGHVGGDDFVVATTPNKAERLCQAVVRCCARLLPSFYDAEHRRAGQVKARGRDGKPGVFPLVSISLGIVDCLSSCSLLQVSQRAAEVKCYAKSRPGNVYVRDRRRSPK
ncbi:MAG: GGDEF domain-containing protein [Desulfarculaceae bacterium]|nr:GGDEF domain-containing protein [Desulfarculaceae bacterium]MCF8045943.1 GGDEF domain-containing protein [Desulfarculaceae bacterium]MCF8063672.1 GGDEF domain-containing protein [Desulfarculaceae bacterium]MCF8098402.1 GGDEF domain-containing protein [Desulfarculaceae bacterium]MCF8121146.1 GGDEF domain-containing protein [Desulfarculaceae bacterium]